MVPGTNSCGDSCDLYVEWRAPCKARHPAQSAVALLEPCRPAVAFMKRALAIQSTLQAILTDPLHERTVPQASLLNASLHFCISVSLTLSFKFSLHFFHISSLSLFISLSLAVPPTWCLSLSAIISQVNPRPWRSEWATFRVQESHSGLIRT